MLPYLFYLARLIPAYLTGLRIFSLSVGIATLIGFVGQYLWQSPGIGVLGIPVFIILIFILPIARRYATVSVTLQEPGNPRAQRDDHYRIDGQSIRLLGFVTIPEPIDSGCTLYFSDTRAYGVSLSNYPKGVNRVESKPNVLKVEEGVQEFEFTMKIERITEHSGTYTMEIHDPYNGHHLGEITLEL